MEKAREYHAFLHQKRSAQETHIFIRADYSIRKIALAEICYVQGLFDYLKIYLSKGKPVVVRMTMRNLAEQLPENFIRVHRSYIIPLSRIKSVRNKVISIPKPRSRLEKPTGRNL